MRKTCLNEIYLLAQKDPRVVFFGSDIGAGTLDPFKKEMPDRFFMEGVCEANIIGMMAGLAMNGKVPYFNTIAVFLTRRCYEQLFLDAAMHNLKIRLIGSGGGLVYAPLGPTHLAFEDFSLLRIIPNMTIVAPCDAEEMKRLMPQTLAHDGPMYIRLAKGGDPVVSDPQKEFRIGQAILRSDGREALAVTTGITLKTALDAAGELKKQGVSLRILHFPTLKPFDAAALKEAALDVKVIVSVEENSIIGGLGSAAAEVIAEAGFSPSKKFLRIGLPDVFPVKYGSQDQLMEHGGVTAGRVASEILKLLGA